MKTILGLALATLFIACNVSNENKESSNLKHTNTNTVNIAPEETIIEAPKKTKPAIIQSLEDQGMIRVDSLDPTIKVELKYATTDNFTGEILYDELNELYLHPIAALKLVDAHKKLKAIDSTLTLLVYDGVRPQSIQYKMYKVVQGTRYQSYVANPDRTGLHNYGIAVDLTICKEDGTPLDMGTKFDFFGKAAGINKEQELKAQGLLNDKQIKNRQLLRKVMTEAGFLTIRGEWWHFNALSLAEAKKKTKLIK